MIAKQKKRASLEWVLVTLSLVLCVTLFMARGSMATAGDLRTVTITVIPSDVRALTCASSIVVEGLQCEAPKIEHPLPHTRPPEKKRLAPYVTVEGELIVLSGVFGYESVQKETQRRRQLPKKKRRFSVRCEIKLLQHLTSLPVRFGLKAQYMTSGPLWIARTRSCSPV